MKENIDEIMKWANLLFLFLFSLHLYNFPDKFIILWCGFFMLVFVMQYKKLCLDRIFWILALAIILNGLGTYYYLRDSLGYTWGNIIKMVVPTILVYPYMKQLAWNRKDEYLEKIILAIALGTFVYSMLNYYSFWEGGSVFINGERRSWCDFWTRYGWASTQYSYWGCFIVGLGGYGFYLLSERKWIKGILVLGMIAVENYIQIAVLNRMVLCITLVSFAVSFLMFLFLNRKDGTKIRQAIIALLLVFAVIILFIVIKLPDVQSNDDFQSILTRDGGIFKNVRFQMIYEAILKLPSHWKGGATMWAAGNYWVHNYWLQVANVSGLLPFILWMIVNVSVVIDTIKIIKHPEIGNRVKYMLIPMVSAIVGYLMMEPGGTESNRYIIFYVLLIALMKQIANNGTNSKKTGIEHV